MLFFYGRFAVLSQVLQSQSHSASSLKSELATLQTDLALLSCSSFTFGTFLPAAEKSYCRKKDVLATVMQMIKAFYSGHAAKCSIKKKKKTTRNQVIGAHKPRE